MAAKLTAALLVAWTTAAGAQSAEWQGLTDQAIAFHRQGQYEKALEPARKALDLATRECRMSPQMQMRRPFKSPKRSRSVRMSSSP